MDDIRTTLTDDHRRCDELFARTEKTVAQRNWAQADRDFSGFIAAMENHLRFEEESLFPALEQATGSSDGPTQVMRLEHGQMRALFKDMGEGIGTQDKNRYLGLSETLLILMQQHNMKEEHILYRMADQALGNKASALVARLENS
jgi:hemerythrin-like domain-containing protein